MRVVDLLGVLDRLAPVGLAEPWDNVGLLVGRRDRPVGGVMVALDLRPAVLDEAGAHGCDVVVTHHPPLFPSVASVTDGDPVGRLVLRAAESGVAIVSAHTNLDAARGGLNDLAADLLGIGDAVPLAPSAADPDAGLGRIGALGRSTGVASLALLAGRVFDGAACRYVGDPERPVRRVAVCTGSGASLIGAAADAGADLYVTGDLKYHDADRVDGMALLCVPHGAAERVTLRAWTPALSAALGPDGPPVRFAAADTDPWRSVPG